MTAHRVGIETRFLRRNSVSRALASLLFPLALLLLGYWLRVYNLDAFSFWTDEGLTPERSGYSIAQILRNEIVIQGIVTRDTHPPLYYLINHFTRRLFGDSDFAFRYPSVLFGVLLIPLLYRLGRRLPSPPPSPSGRGPGRGAGTGLGLLVALLAAVNPLHVYYSQEARMYTLLVLLATAMSYVLWGAVRTVAGEQERTSSGGRTSAVVRHLILYIALAALAVYTHYTAAFLVAAQALFWGWLLWRSGLKRGIIAAAIVAVVAAAPLIPYTIPRLLAGAEANYYVVAPLTMLADVVRFFSLGLTVDFDHPFIVALNWLALGVALVGLWAVGQNSTPGRKDARTQGRNAFLRPGVLAFNSSVVRRWVTRLFLLAWLLAVPLGLMLGSALFKPMYQGVRHIMAGSPAFILLLGLGLIKIRDTRYEIRRPYGSFVSRISYLVFPIALLLMVAGSALALHNLYTVPAYGKDDFRAIVRFIETRAGNQDVIVYNNAVLLPLHEHYRLRDDIAVTALPAYPQLATGQEPELAALAAAYDRVWFITDPPADGRDDEALIRGWLDANLLEVSDRTFPARTTEARVIGYSTRAGVTADARPPLSGIRDWGDSLQLSGVSVRGPNPLSLPTLWVDLFWQGQRPSAGEQLLFSLAGPDGQEVYRHGHALVRDGGRSWQTTGLNRISYDLPLPPGLPPGPYTLSLAPEGGELRPLVAVEVASTDTWPVPPEALFGDGELAAVGRRPAASWPNGLALAAVVPWDDAVLPGNNLPLTLFWRVGPDGIDLSEVRYRLEVIDRQGAVLRTQEARPGAPWLGRVAPGALLREVTALYFQPEIEPSDYRLRWTLLEGNTPLGAPVTTGRATVEPWPMVTEAPPAAHAIAADFGPAIRLIGYDLGEPAGGRLDVTLYWQAVAETDTSYVVFLHLVDEAGHIAGQVDALPAGGARPTTGWRAGEVITDAYSLVVPADLPPGRYHLNAGLYNPDDGARPAVTIDGAPQPDNQLRLATFDLPEETR